MYLTTSATAGLASPERQTNASARSSQPIGLVVDRIPRRTGLHFGIFGLIYQVFRHIKGRRTVAVMSSIPIVMELYFIHRFRAY